jgi:hypothetical protein
MAPQIASLISINEHKTEPLSDHAVDFLTALRKECPYLDFKLTLDISKSSNFPEIAKDILAFSNYGGGWILIGWKEYKSSQFIPVGLPQDYKIDSAALQEKFNSFIDCPISIEYREFDRDFSNKFKNLNEEVKTMINSISKRFGAIFIPPSRQELIPKKDGSYKEGDKQRTPFKTGDIMYRRGTQSILASKKEIEIIKKRSEKEDHRISILSGEPDNIDEELLSNLFKLNKLPTYVYLGDKKPYDDSSIKYLLEEKGVKPAFFYKFKEWNKKIVTFENLQDENNPYSALIESKSATRELFQSWFDDEDKRRIVIELLNKELIHYAISKGMHYDFYRNSLFYAIYKNESETRKLEWSGRYRSSTKTVAAKMFASQLGKSIFWHIAFSPSIQIIDREIYLKIIPNFVITEEGTRSISGAREGTIITRLSYSMHNSKYLNNILFWINQLSDNGLIKIRNYIEIDSNPTKLVIPKGIIFDIPSGEFEDSSEEEQEEVTEDLDEL